MSDRNLAPAAGAVALLLALTGLPACTTTPTGTTKDMFEMTSSTSGRTWFSIDGYAREEFKVIAFTTSNFANLKQDMARGQGEYLTSFATLLGIPSQRHADFSAWVQAQYPGFVPSHETSPDAMLASVRQAMPADFH